MRFQKEAIFLVVFCVTTLVRGNNLQEVTRNRRQQSNGPQQQSALHDSLVLSTSLTNSLGLQYPSGFEQSRLNGYTFRNRSLLLKALLHPVYKAKQRKNDLTNFEPLDYIGSFVLDFIVSRYILKNSPKKDKQSLEVARTRVARNDIMAFLAVKNDFHNYVFVDGGRERSSLLEYANSVQNLSASTQLKSARRQHSFIHKFFKSVAGAIYLDSNYDLDAVERVYLKMLQPELDSALIQ